ncbi:hypothetical protein LptCag_0566 [Leptospirillum ferriphilum]|uniref:Uncharacterized protein n=1 Tax=Leptospirillum ferriphilum TaxID=178606 RepID=A0A094WBQ0_9BACT|nr:hypothetical protein LptCag_0566 [Leptospirillum ferriphilum]
MIPGMDTRLPTLRKTLPNFSSSPRFSGRSPKGHFPLHSKNREVMV